MTVKIKTKQTTNNATMNLPLSYRNKESTITVHDQDSSVSFGNETDNRVSGTDDEEEDCVDFS